MLILFILTVCISFFGSIQLGPVNSVVITTCIQQNKRKALILALGGVLPEILYAALAIYSLNIYFFAIYLNVFLYIGASFFFIVSIYYLFKKHSKNNLIKSENISNPFLTGFLLAIFNFQLYPFWLSILLFYKTNNILVNTFLQKIIFVLSTSIGAYLILYLFILLAQKYKQQLLLKLNKLNTNYFLAVIFLTLSLLQFYKLIF